MKKLSKFFVALVLVIFAHAVFSVEYERIGVVPNSIMSLSVDRKASTKDVLKLFLNPDNWGASSCKQTTAYISKSDTHIISTLLSALAQNQSLDIGVEDTLTLFDGTCQVTYIRVTIN